MYKLYLAPMEELTGYVFRNVIERHFGNVDKYFTPFISPDNRIMKTHSRNELERKNNEGLNVVPQLLTNDADQFNEAADLIAGMGYEEININFGCPSNTVASKYKGSGILRAPEILERFLEGVFNGEGSALRKYHYLRISVKTRVGYNDTSDFDKVIEIFNRYPFGEVIIHPRIKKDLYNGNVRAQMFDMACDGIDKDIVYNGDIFSAVDHDETVKRFEEGAHGRYSRVKAVMIGRGAVQNPGIFRQIKTGQKITKSELYDFLKDLYETYEKDYGEVNALSKMKEVWSYTVRFIPDEKERSRIFKTIIKANDVHRYNDAIMVASKDLVL